MLEIIWNDEWVGLCKQVTQVVALTHLQGGGEEKEYGPMGTANSKTAVFRTTYYSSPSASE
jgi:hypothetical protein